MRADTKKAPNGAFCLVQKDVAEWTGLEPATLDVTGRYSNQLNYHSVVRASAYGSLCGKRRIIQKGVCFATGADTKTSGHRCRHLFLLKKQQSFLLRHRPVIRHGATRIIF